MKPRTEESQKQLSEFARAIVIAFSAVLCVLRFDANMPAMAQGSAPGQAATTAQQERDAANEKKISSLKSKIDALEKQIAANDRNMVEDIKQNGQKNIGTYKKYKASKQKLIKKYKEELRFREMPRDKMKSEIASYVKDLLDIEKEYDTFEDYFYGSQARIKARNRLISRLKYFTKRINEYDWLLLYYKFRFGSKAAQALPAHGIPKAKVDEFYLATLASSNGAPSDTATRTSSRKKHARRASSGRQARGPVRGYRDLRSAIRDMFGGSSLQETLAHKELWDEIDRKRRNTERILAMGDIRIAAWDARDALYRGKPKQFYAALAKLEKLTHAKDVGADVRTAAQDALDGLPWKFVRGWAYTRDDGTVAADPDPFIRLQLMREGDPSIYGGGDGGGGVD
jgi:hypothetical protein